MALTEFSDVLSGQSVVPPGPLLQALEGRIIYVVKRTENPTTLTPGAVTALYFGNVLFEYDPADAISIHDGLTVIVTADGKRFKADGFAGKRIAFRSVLDKDLSTPPGSPALGDRYIVGAAGTGDWAGRDKNVTEWSARGWVFHLPARWDVCLVDDEAAFYHYNASAVWTLGLPGSTLGAGTVGLAQLKYGLGLAVQSQTVNDPPGSPTEGVAYIIGPAPTGAWAGQAGDLTIYEGSAWIIYTPQSGWTVTDLTNNRLLLYVSGTGWIDPLVGSAGLCVKRTFVESAITSETSYSTGNIIEANHAAVSTGNILELTIRMTFAVEDASGGATVAEQIDFRVDSETDARHQLFEGNDGGDSDGDVQHFYSVFYVAAPDTASHLYRIRPRDTGGGIKVFADLVGTVQVRPPQMMIKEFAP